MSTCCYFIICFHPINKHYKKPSINFQFQLYCHISSTAGNRLICRPPNFFRSDQFFLRATLLDGEQKKQKISEIKAGIDEAETLIRKMDTEARSLPPNVKAVLLAKLREYKSDLNNLKSEIKRIASSNLNQAARDELLESGMADATAMSADQRGRLLTSTERLNKSSDRVRDSRRTMLETEELGVSLLQDLHQQRESLLRAHGTLHGVDENISKSKKIMTNISRRMGKNKWIIGSVVAVLIIAIILILYFKLK
ncbi:unnamed protein product [Lactuca virosa]|uniref:Vesicle transport v-SNARE N-terminal domain-containing protein n=1 Tax=Lactuca virosa TaxID=75947 RepID=A0AAU9LWX9_9ASTR|nr:unnamed protein product [Lactuca virosa]